MELNKLLLNRLNNDIQNICFIDNDKSYTVTEFENIISTIRLKFKANKISIGNRVMFVCKKDITTIAGIYACLLEGITFAPIDSKCPKERLNYIIKDLNPKAIICDIENAEKIDLDLLNSINVQLIAHEEIYVDAAVFNNLFPTNNEVNSLYENLCAYILYTSGSTGTPKGVVVNRASLYNFIESSINRAGYTSSTIFLNFFQLHFDPALMEILVPWITGGTCVIYNGSIFINDLIKILQKYKVTDFSCTPNIISQLVGPISRFSKYKWDFLRSIWFGGENANIEDLRKFHKIVKNVVLFNGYGPTETVIACSLHKLEENDFQSEILSIGTPMNNVKFMLLDNELNEINRDDIQGELYVGGKQIMEGYWGQLDDHKNTFLTRGNCKYYPTGDIVFKKDGKYYFIGRKNAMLKIRGYRIYPLEIENAINKIEYINNSIAFCINNNLYAAVEINTNKDCSEHEIIERLKDYLQSYMIPLSVSIYKEFPRLSNGKIDLLTIKSSIL